MASSSNLVQEGVDALKKMTEILENIQTTSKMSAMKLEYLEKRQCATGEGTDSSRYLDQWSRSESAHVSSAQVIEMAHRILEYKTAEVTWYSELFAEKDARRIESLVAFWYITFVKEDTTMWNYNEPNYAELGRLVQYMPSFKQKMLGAARLLKAAFGEHCDVYMPTTALPSHRKSKITPQIGASPTMVGGAPICGVIFDFPWFGRAAVGM